jgi:hypothetical protein
MKQSLQDKHEEMVAHGVVFSLTVSPEVISSMSLREFDTFWDAYGVMIRLLSHARRRLNSKEGVSQ